VARVAVPQVARWVGWHPAAHLAPTRPGCKWVAWVVRLALRWVALRVAQWVVPAPVKWQVAWAHLVDKWAVPVPRVAKWLVAWVLPVDKWVAPVPVRWPVAWARPVDKWAAWA